MSKNCVTYIHRTVWKWHSIWIHIYWHFGHTYHHLDTNITIWIYILQFGHIYCNLDINMETWHIYDFSTYWSCLTSIQNPNATCIQKNPTKIVTYPLLWLASSCELNWIELIELILIHSIDSYDAVIITRFFYNSCHSLLVLYWPC